MENNGMHKKYACVKQLEISEKELNLINRHSIKTLSADDVYTFKLAMCDNEVDRDNERFSNESLAELAKMYIGKTVISDHNWKSANQVARIYAAKVTGEGDYKQLVANCYMLRLEKSSDLIAEIEAGIKKEVSVGFRIGEVICSICGADNKKVYCQHYGGREYDGKKCFFTLEKPLDAYEVSFVAVPAQPKAGAVKDYGIEISEPQKNVNEAELAPSIKSTDAFLFGENERKERL